MDVRIKFRDKDSGEIYLSGAMPLARAIKLRDSGHYRDAVIVIDEMGWPEWKGERKEGEIGAMKPCK